MMTLRSIRGILARLVLLAFRTHASGTEALQRTHVIAGGKVVVTANHVSFLDGVLIALSSPIPMLFAVEHEYSIRNPFTSSALKFLSLLGFGAVVTLDANSRYGIRRMRNALAKGQTVMLFPEGKIGTGLPQPLKPGLEWLLKETGAVEFRIMIRGAEASRIFAKAGRKLWPAIHLIYGETNEADQAP